MIMKDMLLEFFSGFEFVDTEKSLFDKLDHFMTNKFKSSSLSVYSIPKKAKDKVRGIDTCRKIWINENDLPRKMVLETVMEQIYHHLDDDKFWFEHKDLSRFYYPFIMGTYKGQIFWGIFSRSEELDPILMNHFVRFIDRQFFLLRKIEQYSRVEALVYVDDVTGLYNQRKLFKDLDQAILRFDKYKEPFSVLFIDLDHFKLVNDGHGHLIGTKLLEDVAHLLKRQLRENDLIYRYGGDEFVAILPEANSSNGKMVGERVLSSILGHDFHYQDRINGQSKKFKLSASIGVAGYPEDATQREDIVNIADRMMYEAKEAGRGKVFQTKDIFYKKAGQS